MSDDLSEGFKELNQLRKERHADWKDGNLKVIRESGLSFESKNNDEVLLFRDPAKSKVDFYPSTGRWKRWDGQMFSGGADKFLIWYRRSDA